MVLTVDDLWIARAGAFKYHVDIADTKRHHDFEFGAGLGPLHRCDMFRFHRAGALLLALVFFVSLGTVAAQGLSSFQDVEGHWAQEGIERFAAQGFIGGYPDNTFRPDTPLSRAEAVTIIDRFLKPLMARVDSLEAQAADRAPSVVIDAGLAVKAEEVSHTMTDERLEVAVQGFVRNTSKATMDFNPNQIVLVMKDATGETLGTIRPTAEGESVPLEAGEGRQVKAGFKIEGEQLANDRLASLVVGVVDSQGDVQALGINISLECSWPPLRCRLTIKFSL